MPRAMTEETFEREVLRSTRPVIVDFWAPWCGPCRAVSPVLEQIAAERVEELEVVKVDVDSEPMLAVRYGVATIPTILLFAGGEPVARVVGARSKRRLEEALGLAPLAGTETRSGAQSLLRRLRRSESSA